MVCSGMAQARPVMDSIRYSRIRLRSSSIGASGLKQTGDGTVELTMVCRNDCRAVRPVFDAGQLHFRDEQPDKALDDTVEEIVFSFFGCHDNRILPEKCW